MAHIRDATLPVSSLALAHIADATLPTSSLALAHIRDATLPVSSLALPHIAAPEKKRKVRFSVFPRCVAQASNLEADCTNGKEE